MIGDELRKARKSCGISQAKLAELCGVSEATICGTERGTTSPQLANLEAILDAIGMKLEVVPK